MKHLLVGIDGSDGGDAAVEEALALAPDLRATLTFVCVRIGASKAPFTSARCSRVWNARATLSSMRWSWPRRPGSRLTARFSTETPPTRS
jgi:hypothetical protein